MSLSTPFIHRPIGTTLLTIAIALAGILSYFFLPVAPLPQVDSPTINVSASLPGASPETMASSVVTPLERQFGRIAGITEMTSSASLGSCGITLVFDLSRDINGAARDVQAAINAAASQLPANLPGKPNYRKSNPADAPIMLLSVTSDIYDRGQMYDAASSILAQKLSQIDGVGQVSIGGGALPAIRVEVNPMTLNAMGLGLSDLRAFLSSVNVNRPKGQLSGPRYQWDLAATDQLYKARDYRPLIVTYRNGAAVQLSDVANVVDSVEDIRTSGFANGKPAIILVIFRQAGANIIETVDRVSQLLPQLQASIPAGMKIGVVMERTSTIKASVRDVEIALLISIVLVVLVVFFFLRDPRATLIPSVAVPISLIGTFGVMYLCGFSIDNFSLMALAVATGFVVDDAIVVIENITRHLEAGMQPLPAALLGAKEIGFTVLSMSISLMAVFIPILLMGGYIGRLFREFAVVLAVAVGISMVISLTTTPMMCAVLLKSRDRQRHGRLYRASEKMDQFIVGLYRHSLAWVLRHSVLMLMVTLATMACTILLYVGIPKELVPEQDIGRISGSLTADQNISSQAMRNLMAKYVAVVAADPAVDNIAGYTGSSNKGNIFVALKPLSERNISAKDLIVRLDKKLASIAGGDFGFQSQQDIRPPGGRSSAAMYQFTLQGENLQELQEWAPKVQDKITRLPGMGKVTSDLQLRGLQAYLTIDRDTASRLGLTASQVDNLLYDAFGQRQVSTMYTSLNQYHVVMEVDPRFAQDPTTLKYIYAINASGDPIPLSSFVHFSESATPLSIAHQSQFPCVTISFNLLPNASLGDAVAQILQSVHDMGLPASIRGSFSGAAGAFQQSTDNNIILIIAAIIAVYLVLGILYESLIHPITILSTIPSAGVGALLALIVFKINFSLIALIGIILLIGIVKKNAIMMIDFALDAERTEGKSPRDAIFQACLLRFRPITMTTAAAMLGGLPLALGGGIGSELRKPLGIAIVGGLIFSQLLTLYTTPVIYLYLDRLRHWATGKKTDRLAALNA